MTAGTELKTAHVFRVSVEGLQEVKKLTDEIGKIASTGENAAERTVRAMRRVVPALQDARGALQMQQGIGGGGGFSRGHGTYIPGLGRAESRMSEVTVFARTAPSGRALEEYGADYEARMQLAFGRGRERGPRDPYAAMYWQRTAVAQYGVSAATAAMSGDMAGAAVPMHAMRLVAEHTILEQLFTKYGNVFGLAVNASMVVAAASIGYKIGDAIGERTAFGKAVRGAVYSWSFGQLTSGTGTDAGRAGLNRARVMAGFAAAQDVGIEGGEFGRQMRGTYAGWTGARVGAVDMMRQAMAGGPNAWDAMFSRGMYGEGVSLMGAGLGRLGASARSDAVARRLLEEREGTIAGLRAGASGADAETRGSVEKQILELRKASLPIWERQREILKEFVGLSDQLLQSETERINLNRSFAEKLFSLSPDKREALFGVAGRAKAALESGDAAALQRLQRVAPDELGLLRGAPGAGGRFGEIYQEAGRQLAGRRGLDWLFAGGAAGTFADQEAAARKARDERMLRLPEMAGGAAEAVLAAVTGGQSRLKAAEIHVDGKVLVPIVISSEGDFQKALAAELGPIIGNLIEDAIIRGRREATVEYVARRDNQRAAKEAAVTAETEEVNSAWMLIP